MLLFFAVFLFFQHCRRPGSVPALVPGNIPFQGFHVVAAQPAEPALLMGQKANVHIALLPQGYGNNAFPVQVLVDDPAAYGIAIEPNQQVEQGSPVGYPDSCNFAAWFGSAWPCTLII